MNYTIAPSILSADFSKLGEEIKKVEVNGVSCIHVDVMDGVFVPNITIGAPVVASLKKITKLPLDVHLMIENPEKHVDSFIKSGSDIITFHVEATKHPERLIRYIQSCGVKAGVSLNPATPLCTIEYLHDAVDLILIMTVNPGFGGQKLIPSVLPKIEAIKRIKQKNNYNYIIQIDGGVTMDNINKYVEVGAELIVAGNAVFGADNPTQAIASLIKKGKN